jgi:N-methylhydantoinase A
MIAPLDDAGIGRAGAVLSALFVELAQRTGDRDRSSLEREAALDLRFVGQEHTLTVPLALRDGVPAASSPDALRVFFAEYERAFGHTMHEAVEIVSVRATVRTRLPRREERRPTAADRSTSQARTFEAFSFTRGERVSFSVLERAALPAGEHVAGPAILLEPTTTTYLDVGFVAEVDGSGVLFLTNEET